MDKWEREDQGQHICKKYDEALQIIQITKFIQAEEFQEIPEWVKMDGGRKTDIVTMHIYTTKLLRKGEQIQNLFYFSAIKDMVKTSENFCFPNVLDGSSKL